MRRGLLVLAALAALAAMLVAGAGTASAHPLGNFTVNSYLRVEASGGELYLRQVVNMAEIPSFRERSLVEADGGLAPYAAARARRRAAEIRLTVGGRRVPVTPVSQTASFRPGQGGLQVLRYAAWYRAPGAARDGRGGPVEVGVPTYRDRLGWHELVVRASSGAGVADSTATDEDVSDELRSYPGGLLKSPLDVTEATFAWSPGEGAGAVGPLTADPESRVTESSPGGLSGLVDDDLSFGVVAIALLLADGLGRSALPVARPRQDDGGGVPGGDARHRPPRPAAGPVRDRHPHHRGGRARPGDALRVPLHPPGGPLPLDQPGRRRAGGGGRALGGMGPHGDVPAAPRAPPGAPPRARARGPAPPRPGPRAPGAGPRHGRRGGRAPPPPPARHGIRTRTTARTARATHHGHGHGPGEHTHAPPEDLSMRSLLAVGAAAGIIPCPSALVLLLGAIALHRVGYGLVLVLAFSVGLAGLLSVIGLLVIYARRFIERLPLDGRLAAAIPALSAAAIVALGVVLTVRALPPLL